MKHKLYILSAALMASAVSSDDFAYATPIYSKSRDIEELLYKPSISYNNDVIESPGWKGNWFVGANGGINAFLGTPMGCNDLGGRIKGQFGINAGKWFTPTVGSRVSFNGYWLKGADSRTQDGWGISRKSSGTSQIRCMAPTKATASDLFHISVWGCSTTVRPRPTHSLSAMVS